MKETLGGKQPIIRLTRFSIEASTSGRGKRYRIDPKRWTFYGVDAEGVERVYVEHNTEKEYEAWLETDPLLHEAQGAVTRRLFGNPQTRDVVIQMAMSAALDRGNTDTAAELARHLSPETLRKLMSTETVDGDETASGQ